MQTVPKQKQRAFQKVHFVKTFKKQRTLQKFFFQSENYFILVNDVGSCMVGEGGFHPAHQGSNPTETWSAVIRLEGQTPPGIDCRLFWIGVRDVSALAKSQVSGISGLRAVGYTWGLQWQLAALNLGLAQVIPTCYRFP